MKTLTGKLMSIFLFNRESLLSSAVSFCTSWVEAYQLKGSKEQKKILLAIIRWYIFRVCFIAFDPLNCISVGLLWDIFFVLFLLLQNFKDSMGLMSLETHGLDLPKLGLDSPTVSLFDFIINILHNLHSFTQQVSIFWAFF